MMCARSTESGSPADRRAAWARDALWLAVVFVVALALRLIHVLQLQDSPWFADHDMDPLFHHLWAEAFASGMPFMDGPYFRAPLYGWFLGTIYWLLGSGPFVPRLVQAVVGSLSCGLLVLLGRQAFNRPVGIVAGLAAATYWIFIYFDAELLSPVLVVFINLLLLLCLLHAGRRRSALLWLASGFLLGLSAIARPDILLLAPLLVVWIVILHWRRWTRVVGYAACCACGCLLPIVPVTIRNYVVADQFTLIGTYGGVNFYIGNNPDSDGMSAVIEGDPAEWWPCYQAQVARAEAAEGRPLTASEVSAYYTRAAWRYITSQPDEALGRMLRKALYFWSRWEIPNNQDIYFVTSTYTPLTRFLPLGFWIVGPLGLLGLILSLRRARELFPLWSIVLVYLIVAAAFFVTARFRVPAVAVLILLGSYAVYWCIQAIRARRTVSLGLAAAALIVAGIAVARVPPNVDRLSIQGYRYAGFALDRQGRHEEAAAFLAESLKREAQAGARTEPRTWNALGSIRLKLGQADLAEQCFTRLLALDPDYPLARENLTRVLVSQGKVQEAIPHYRLLCEAQPNNGEVHGALGSALFRIGQREEGLRHLQRAVELEPTHGEIHAIYGSTLVAAGRIDEAVRCLLRGMALDPGQAPVLVRATQGMVQQGKHAEAHQILRKAMDYAPNDASLLVRLAHLLNTCPDPALRDSGEAVRRAARAVEITKQQSPVALHVAANAYWSAGRAAEAVAAARLALQRALQQGQMSLAQAIRKDLEQHAAGDGP